MEIFKAWCLLALVVGIGLGGFLFIDSSCNPKSDQRTYSSIDPEKAIKDQDRNTEYLKEDAKETFDQAFSYKYQQEKKREEKREKLNKKNVKNKRDLNLLSQRLRSLVKLLGSFSDIIT